MRKFISYYGSKLRMAPHYGPPRRPEVCEPFAGSACYSTFWEPVVAHLFDRSPHICAFWDWVIKCSEEDVRRIPAPVRSNEEFLALPDGPRQLVFFTSTYASPRMGRKLPQWYFDYVNGGNRTGAMRTGASFKEWDERFRQRIIDQKPKIAQWSITQCSYEDIPMREAHWHVDPPYQGKPGRSYEFSDIDYPHLADWCRNLPGAVDVCENEGADWLPFTPLKSVSNMTNATRSREVVWRNEPVELLDIMRGTGHAVEDRMD